ncbi:ABC transporter substrate-binding protein, partial [Thermodesulfobacteriota bacterium]
MSILQSLRRVRILPVFVFTTISIFFLSSSAVSSPPGLGNSFEQIVKLASKEGEVRIAASLKSKEVKIVLGGFYKKYPQIKVEYYRITGINAGEKIFTEVLGGHVEYDAVKVVSELRSRFINAGILAGPLEYKRFFPKTPKLNMCPTGYYAGGSFYPRVIAYNPTLVPAERVPRDWDDCLDPYWKGKLVVDVRPNTLVSLYHVWGEQRILEYAKKLKENRPVWKRGPTETLAQLSAGEYHMIAGIPYSIILTMLAKDPRANIGIGWPKVVPVSLNEALGILKGAKNPNAAFLLIGWLASKEAQRGYDKIGRGSPFLEGTESWEAFKKAGAKPVFAGWDE